MHTRPTSRLGARAAKSAFLGRVRMEGWLSKRGGPFKVRRLAAVSTVGNYLLL